MVLKYSALLTAPDLVAWTGDGANDNRVHLFGNSGFSPSNKYFVTQTAGPPVFYQINIDEMQTPHINTTHRIFARCYYEGNLVTFTLGPAVWMTPTKIAYLYGYRIFALDIEKPVGDNYNVELIGDISSFLTNSYYPDVLGIERCSSSRRLRDPAMRPEDPATNVELVSRFLNGLDSDHWYCFQSVLQWSTVLNGYQRWTLFNFINNGYKLALDRSGTWISSQTVNEPEGPSWTVGQQPFLKIKYRPFSEGGGVIRSIVTDWEGHGPLGWEQRCNNLVLQARVRGALLIGTSSRL